MTSSPSASVSAHLRAAWRLLRRDSYVKRHFGGLHLVPLDDVGCAGRTGRSVVDRLSLCGVKVETAGDGTTQPDVVGCWRCALAVARDPERWTPVSKAHWVTYPDGTTVCRTCGGVVGDPPGCSCRKSIRQRLEQVLLARSRALRFDRLREHPEARVPWDGGPA